jgi:hypothetical protein
MSPEGQLNSVSMAVAVAMIKLRVMSFILQLWMDLRLLLSCILSQHVTGVKIKEQDER